MLVRPVVPSPSAPTAGSSAATPDTPKAPPRPDAFERTGGKKRGGHSAEVMALVERYIPREAASLERSFGRILTWAAKIDAIITSATGPEAIVDVMVSKDARRQVFLLEGILRLYEERHGKPVGAALERVKELEDFLGAYVDTRRMTQLARDKKCPLAVVETLYKAEKKARGELLRVVEQRWTPRAGDARVPQLAEMIESFTKLKWDGYQDDRRYLCGELTKRLHKLEKTKYDMGELQEGIHELRRQLRWIPIYCEALDGLVVVDATKRSVPAYAALADDEVAKSKFVQLPPPTFEPAPISFAKTLYVATVKYVLELGDLKDRGEWIEGLAHAYRDSGEADSRKKAHKAAEKAFGASDENVSRDAEKLYRQIRMQSYVSLVRRVFADA